MKLQYKLSIPSPENHLAHVKISANREAGESQLKLFIPSWSPGSYLMREYGRNVRWLKVENSKGERIFTEQLDRGIWIIDWNKSDLVGKDDLEFSVEYEIYCHELTVRTSHIDKSHAFIHGPSVFMGFLDKEMKDPTLEVEINPLWSKISTGLKDISPKRDQFLYTAEDYDTFIDAPLEIGCHETDGFMVDGIPHELAFYGSSVLHDHNMKEDIKKIVEHIKDTMGGIPYDSYCFMTHLAPGLFGGLEHLNSTALQFCSYSLTDKKGYKEWLELVAHEYFHLWNVKRIRPVELGPFDYTKEALTKMHWLTEGLTSFMDQLFILRTDFYSLEEYLECIKTNINRYLSIPGRKFHSLEESSFNAWIKLYRADENHNNSSISYYLKGGLVFFALNILMSEKGKSVIDLTDSLWKRYLDKPEVGVTEEEVFKMLEDICGKEVTDNFIHMIKSTEDIDFEALLKKVGVEVEYEESKVDLGFTPEFKGDRVFVKSVELDGPAYKSGLNAGDEILSVNGLRFMKANIEKKDKFMMPDKTYALLISRLGYVNDINLVTGKTAKRIKSLKASDKEHSTKLLKARMP
jgi:predicted metalloprotease with PDZ domain